MKGEVFLFRCPALTGCWAILMDGAKIKDGGYVSRLQLDRMRRPILTGVRFAIQRYYARAAIARAYLESLEKKDGAPE